MYLNCHSFYSFRYGTLSPEKLAEEAVCRGVNKLTLTDINTISGVYDFVDACKERDIEPIVGIEYRNRDTLCYIGIAQNALGFAELNAHLTDYLLLEKDFPSTAPLFANAYVVYPLSVLKRNTALRAHEYIGVRWNECSLLYHYRDRIPKARFLAWQPVTFVDKTHYNVHRLLRSIDHNLLLSKLEPTHHADINEAFIAPERLTQLYAQAPELLLHTQDILDTCTFQMDTQSPKNKRIFGSSETDDFSLLQKLSQDGLHYRYGASNKEAKTRVERELMIILDLGFCSYFLITWDIIQYARSRGYYHVGRGSGANSIVAYCLGITDV
ncbi:MAG: PHP domain-containing protein, partial [Leadbetterella sp.]